jgi:hypothetical protein
VPPTNHQPQQQVAPPASILIPVSLLDQIVNHLAQEPYAQVVGLMQGIQMAVMDVQEALNEAGGTDTIPEEEVVDDSDHATVQHPA